MLRSTHVVRDRSAGIFFFVLSSVFPFKQRQEKTQAHFTERTKIQPQHFRLPSAILAIYYGRRARLVSNAHTHES